MKTLILIIISCTIFIQHLSAQSHHANDAIPTLDIYRAFVLGANYNQMLFTDNYVFDQISPKPGFIIGVGVKLDYIYQYFEVDINLLYTRKGGAAAGMSTYLPDSDIAAEHDRNYTLNYIDMPVMFNLTTNPRKNNRLYLGGGLMFSIGSSGKIKNKWHNPSISKQTEYSLWKEESPEILHRGDISAIGQVGYRWNKNREIRIGFSQSLANIDTESQTIKNSGISLTYVIYGSPIKTRSRVRRGW